MECPVCAKLAEDPRLLKCGHFMCLGCAEEQFLSFALKHIRNRELPSKRLLQLKLERSESSKNPKEEQHHDEKMQVDKQSDYLPTNNEQNYKTNLQNGMNDTKAIVNDYNAIITCPCCKGETEITSIDQLQRDEKVAKEVDDFKNQSTYTLHIH